jgi:hypothetical protein
LWKSFKDKTFIARQLSFSEWLLLAEAWWLLLAFSLVLHWVSYERLKNSTPPMTQEISDSSRFLAFAQRLQRLVELASRLHWVSMTCLVRSLTLRWMLIRRGIPARLRIGAKKSLVGVHAHAWVEIMGQAIGESEDIDERFKILKPIQG